MDDNRGLGNKEKMMNVSLREEVIQLGRGFLSIYDCLNAPLQEWLCGNCHKRFLDKFPKRVDFWGKCPWCWNDDPDTIYRRIKC
jgi:hypothetical protein